MAGEIDFFFLDLDFDFDAIRFSTRSNSFSEWPFEYTTNGYGKRSADMYPSVIFCNCLQGYSMGSFLYFLKLSQFAFRSNYGD